MFICSGILFNHESPRRGINFVTNKVVLESVKISKGLSEKLVLGNLDARRDWGHAKDYVRGMWMMLQTEKPKDYILSTGVSRSVDDLVSYVFGKLELSKDKHLATDRKYERPEELYYLCGDSNQARTELGWKPEYTFESMIDEMIEYWQNNI
jgi:GDPmannose 4,6-dehydratase